jgi:predicted nucleotidyltransferase
MLFQEAKLIALAEKYNVIMVLLFGSSVKESYHEGGDLDLGIQFSHIPQNSTTVLTELISIFKGYTIDVVVLNHSDPVLKFEIISNYKILYCKDKEIFINFYLNTIKQYNDIQKLLKLEQIFLNNFSGGARSGIHQCDPPQINQYISPNVSE